MWELLQIQISQKNFENVGTHKTMVSENGCLKICNVTKSVGTTANSDFTEKF